MPLTRACNLLLLLLLALLQYRLWFSAGGAQDLRRLRHLEQSQVAENEARRERNRRLAAEVLDLQQGHAAIEDRARGEMGMIRRGEVFYQLVGAEEPPPAAADPNAPRPEVPSASPSSAAPNPSPPP